MFSLGTKMLSFFTLVCIQTVAALMFKISQRNAHYNYAPSSAQTTAEVIKLAISSALLTRVVLHELRAEVDLKSSESCVMLAARVWSRFWRDLTPRLVIFLGSLAALYCFNNQLAFMVFRLADAASVSLVKSASTAVSTALLWLFLSRPATQPQLICIALQSLGLFVAQYDACKHSPVLPLRSYFLLLLSLFITSLSGVANEKLLKGENAHMHVQNVCLYVFGIMLNLAIFLFTERKPFFHGYSIAAWGVIACQALLGIAVTFVLKYADVVIRCLASSCAVSTLYAINVLFLGFEYNPVYIAGAATVFLSTYMYFTVSAGASETEISLKEVRNSYISAFSVSDDSQPNAQCKQLCEDYVWFKASSGLLLLFVALAVVLYAEADLGTVR